MTKNGDARQRYASPLIISDKAPPKMGRPKGAMRAEKLEILKIVRDLGPEAVRKLKNLMRNGATETIQFAAAQALLERGYGKPPQALAVGVDAGAGQPLIIVTTGVPRANDDAIDPKLQIDWEQLTPKD